MFYLILALIIIAIIALPQFWVKRVIDKHNRTRKDIKGTGAEFARHLLSRLELKNVAVEPTDQGDHYDPDAKAVRLSKAHFDTRSLSAMVIAAHEVGHAIQDAEQEPWMKRRKKLVAIAIVVEKIAPIAFLVGPLLLAITKSPLISAFMILIAILSMATSSLMHFITLPVEFDASFNKALPILKKGNYLESSKDQKAAEEILKAAALTYVAASLFNLLNVGYWLRRLRH